MSQKFFDVTGVFRCSRLLLRSQVAALHPRRESVCVLRLHQRRECATPPHTPPHTPSAIPPHRALRLTPDLPIPPHPTRVADAADAAARHPRCQGPMVSGRRAKPPELTWRRWWNQRSEPNGMAFKPHPPAKASPLLDGLAEESDSAEVIASHLPRVTFEGEPVDIAYATRYIPAPVADGSHSDCTTAMCLTHDWHDVVFKVVAPMVCKELPGRRGMQDYVLRVAENLLATREEGSVEAAVAKAVASSEGWLVRAKDHAEQLMEAEARVRRMIKDHVNAACALPFNTVKDVCRGLESPILHQLRRQIRTDEYVADGYDTDPSVVKQAIDDALLARAERGKHKSAVRAEKLARKAACHVCKAKEEDGAEFSNAQKMTSYAKCKQCILAAQEAQEAEAKAAKQARKASKRAEQGTGAANKKQKLGTGVCQPSPSTVA